MRPIQWLIRGVIAASFVTHMAAHAESGANADMFKQHGGIYAADCANAASPRVRVASDSVVIAQGTKRMTGRNLQAISSYFGRSPPPNFQVAIVGEVRQGVSLELLVYRDKSGTYLTLDGDPKIKAALGKALLSYKYRQCGVAHEASTAMPSKEKPTESLNGAWDLLTDAAFKSVYHGTLGGMVREVWLAKLDGPSEIVKKIDIDGTEYLFAKSCKNRDCGNNRVMLLYSSAKKAVYIKIFQGGKVSTLGAPPQLVAAELARLWAIELARK